MLGQYFHNGHKLTMSVYNDVIYSEWENGEIPSVDSFDSIEDANMYLEKLGLNPLPIPTETMKIGKWYMQDNPCEYYIKGYSMMDKDKRYKTLLVHSNDDSTYDVVLFDHYTLTPLEMLEMLQNFSKEKGCENPNLHDAVTLGATDYGYSGMDEIWRNRDLNGVNEVLTQYGVSDLLKEETNE